MHFSGQSSPTPLPDKPVAVDVGYGEPSQAQGTKMIKGWEFTSLFDGGNALWCSWTRQEPFKAKPGGVTEDVEYLTFSVEIARDCHGLKLMEKPKASWFYFGVTPERRYKGTVKFSVQGMCEQRDLFAAGYRPWVSSPSSPRWRRLDGDVEVGASKLFHWHCSWKYTFDGTEGMTRFAFCHPYGYGELMSWLNRLDAIFCRPRPRGRMAEARVIDSRRSQREFLERFELGLAEELPEAMATCSASSSSSHDEADAAEGGKAELNYFEDRDWHDDVPRAGTGIYYRRQTVARTPQGRWVEMLTITEEPEDAGDGWPRDELPEEVKQALHSRGAQSAASAKPPLRFPGRPVCFVSSRVHPGETPGQFAANGFLQFVLSDDPRAAQLRRQFVFKIVPMLNPDGVAWGHYRTNTLGCDLNRCYRNPTPEMHEGVFAAKSLLLGWAERGDLLFYMDCHGHAARRGCFLFGNHHCSQAWSSEDALLWNLAYVHSTQLNCPHIDIDACEWSRAIEAKKGRGDTEQEDEVDETSRSDSGRAQIGASCRLYHAYTLECNYHISRTVRPSPDVPGLPPGAYLAQALQGEVREGKRPKPMPYGPREWAAVGEGLAVALLDLHCISAHSRLVDARPPRPLLPPDKDLALVSMGLERLFNALSARHRSAGTPQPVVLHGEGGPSLRRRIFKVVHTPHVYIRDKPAKTGSSLGIRKTGETMAALEVRSDGWIKLDPSELKKLCRKGCTEAYMMVDGTSVGLGVLLADTKQMEPFPIADYMEGGVVAQVAPSIEDVEQGLYPVLRTARPA
uniref:Peptidase M14 domain-containing protein n=1 Tax=Alexandrium catenella TaxID=2925 RepID=A0A7S1KYV4_ALECA|mmetsp:Transcript_103195/g.274380  ORF Transcript_103195/g.274380 Transcript_103195/m.274380 type:complete len:795 (+) Transcript_103195:131-2515(+)